MTHYAAWLATVLVLIQVQSLILKCSEDVLCCGLAPEQEGQRELQATRILSVTSVDSALTEHSQLAAAGLGHRLAACVPLVLMGVPRTTSFHPLLLPHCHRANECPQCIRSSLQARSTGS